MADYIGTAGNDRLTGGVEDDRIFGLAGDDTLKGGAGSDTAVLSGNLTECSWVSTRKGWDVVGPDGTDSLEEIEFLEFDDYTFSLAGDNAPSATRLRR